MAANEDAPTINSSPDIGTIVMPCFHPQWLIIRIICTHSGVTEKDTVYARIQARASVSFLAFKIRLQNETGVYLCSTVLIPGHMVHAVPCDNTVASLDRVYASSIAFTLCLFGGGFYLSIYGIQAQHYCNCVCTCYYHSVPGKCPLPGKRPFQGASEAALYRNFDPE